MTVAEIISLAGSTGLISGVIGYFTSRKKNNADLVSKYQEMYDTYVEDTAQQYQEMKQYFERKIEYLELELKKCRENHK